MVFVLLAVSCTVIMAALGLALFLLRRTRAMPSLLAPFLASLLALAVILGLREGAEKTPEYLSYYYTGATYQEDWNEWVHESCCTDVCTGSGDDRRCTQVCTDCSHEEYHGPAWYAEDNSGGTHGISEDFYRTLKSSWGNEAFKELGRDFYTNDGDEYSTCMPDSMLRVGSKGLMGFSTVGSYKNKVKNSLSVFSYQKIDSSDVAAYGLFGGTSLEPLQGISDPALSGLLRQANWLHGFQDQLYLSVMVFFDKPVQVGPLQESHMAGGNKNEFTVLIGLSGKDSSILWVRPVSWTTSELLKVQVRDSIAAMGRYEGAKIGTYLASEVPKKFVRRQFAEFSYLPDTETLPMYLLALLLPVLGGIIGGLIAWKADCW